MYVKKLIPGIVCFCLASSVLAQSLTPSEQEVNIAFATLRGYDKTLFRLQGNEYFGSTTTVLQSDFFWDRPLLSSAQDMKFELLEAQNSVLFRRVVGDGRHAWGIDLAKSQYSVARYGSYTAAKPADYESNGLQNLNVLASGQSSYLARLTREVWGGVGSQYRPWIPASSNRGEFTVQGVGATLKDPVVPTRVYSASLTKKFHVYWVTQNGVNTRSLTFELDENSGTGNWDLTAIYYSDYVKLGKIGRMTDWKTTIYTGILPSPGNFIYTPIAGSRAVAGPRPNGGG